VAFRDLFPWTYAFWRFLCLRGTRRVISAAASLLALCVIGFRLESAIFQWRIHTTLKTIARIKLDKTSERELLELMPKLGLEPAEQQLHDSSLKRYSWIDGDVENGILIRLITNDSGQQIDRLLSAIGHRFHRYGVTALVRNGRVVKIGYFLWLDDIRNHNMYSGIGIDVTLFSRIGWDAIRDKNTIPYDDLAPYDETVASNAPENVLHICTTLDTPDAFRQAAFAVNLTCLFGVTECQNTRQILPEVQPPHFPWRHRNLEDPFHDQL
jgi:hypothetical protein